jgi:hypothetical protein
MRTCICNESRYAPFTLYPFNPVLPLDQWHMAKYNPRDKIKRLSPLSFFYSLLRTTQETQHSCFAASAPSSSSHRYRFRRRVLLSFFPNIFSKHVLSRLANIIMSEPHRPVAVDVTSQSNVVSFSCCASPWMDWDCLKLEIMI